MRDFIKDFGPTFISLMAVIFSGVSLFVVSVYNRRSLIQKQREDERKEIYQKLNSFYGPLQRLLGKSEMLHGIFTHSRGQDFRTLVALLEGEELEGNDIELLNQILKLGKEMDSLILKNSGLIDNEELKRVLDRASTHFSLIRLAKEKKLTGQVERFSEHVFPRDLSPRIEEEVRSLKGRLHELNVEIQQSFFTPIKNLFKRYDHWIARIRDEEVEP